MGEGVGFFFPSMKTHQAEPRHPSAVCFFFSGIFISFSVIKSQANFFEQNEYSGRSNTSHESDPLGRNARGGAREMVLNRPAVVRRRENMSPATSEWVFATVSRAGRFIPAVDDNCVPLDRAAVIVL